jgi:K+-transporting ATPase ATPase C chain
MFQLLRTALTMFVGLTILTGLVYPALVTCVSYVCFPSQASGSWILRGDQVVGSEWIGQSFSQPQYFWGRLSATGTYPYNATASGGSNYGPAHPDLKKVVGERISQLHAHPHGSGKVPVDLVTASGSGLDPHISPAAAAYQIPRIVAQRKLPEQMVQQLVQQHTESRTWGLFGEPRVHVLRLNLALDTASQPPSNK